LATKIQLQLARQTPPTNFQEWQGTKKPKHAGEMPPHVFEAFMTASVRLVNYSGVRTQSNFIMKQTQSGA
jgi:hypothetical protein